MVRGYRGEEVEKRGCKKKESTSVEFVGPLGRVILLFTAEKFISEFSFYSFSL